MFISLWFRRPGSPVSHFLSGFRLPSYRLPTSVQLVFSAFDSIPIERAVPSTVFMAASMSLALRSGILISAISLTWALVTDAHLDLVGLGRSLVDPGSLAQQGGGRRGLDDEREGAVLVDRDLGREDHPPLR